jgi:hypothetical protein
LSFYAHLVAASWAGLRLGSVQMDSIAQGVEFHHHCDRHFHRLEAFRSHEGWTLQHMLSAGLRRGPARGVAHVGVELCLDGALIGEADSLYLRALEEASELEPQWQEPADAHRFRRLIERLREIGVPRGYQDPNVVTQRLLRILTPRPLLALADEEPARLQSAMPEVHSRVSADADSIMSALRTKI